jgi:undecaprenyl-diphosphatase
MTRKRKENSKMAITQKRITLLSGMIILTILFVILVLNDQNPAWLHLGKIIQSHLYNNFGYPGKVVFAVITYVGSAYVSYPTTAILIVYLSLKRKKWIAFLLAFNLIGVYALNWALKTIIARPRPELEHLVHAGYYSFPSGHSMDSTAFFGFLAYLLTRHLRRKGKRTIWVGIAAALLIFLIGLSRVYLGVHYPMDVIGGFLCGGTWLLVTLFVDSFISAPERPFLNKQN